MKKLAIQLIIAVMTYFSGEYAEAAVGEIINIRIGGPTAVNAYTLGAAIPGLTNQTWNNITVAKVPSSAGPLKYSDNSNSTVYGSYLMDGSIANGTTLISGADNQFMVGYGKAAAVSSAYCDFTGLSAGTYNVYVYSQASRNTKSVLNLTAKTSGGNTYQFDLSTTGKLTSLSEKTLLNPNGNWMMQTIEVGADGKLNMTLGSNSVLNGIQLVQTSGGIVAVPEPGSTALIGIGAVIFAGISKMRYQKESYREA